MVPHRATEVDEFGSLVDATPLAAARIRTDFEHWVRSTRASEDTVQELAIVISELVANAVHATPTGPQQIEASAWTEDGTIVLRIANPITPSSVPVNGPDLDDPLRTGGRGLLIVRAYTDVLRTELADGTLAIRCERRIDG